MIFCLKKLRKIINNQFLLQFVSPQAGNFYTFQITIIEKDKIVRQDLFAAPGMGTGIGERGDIIFYTLSNMFHIVHIILFWLSISFDPIWKNRLNLTASPDDPGGT